jgi:hypothetical protein
MRLLSDAALVYTYPFERGTAALSGSTSRSQLPRAHCEEIERRVLTFSILPSAMTNIRGLKPIMMPIRTSRANHATSYVLYSGEKAEGSSRCRDQKGLAFHCIRCTCALCRHQKQKRETMHAADTHITGQTCAMSQWHVRIEKASHTIASGARVRCAGRLATSKPSVSRHRPGLCRWAGAAAWR